METNFKLPPHWREVRDWYFRRIDGAEAWNDADQWYTEDPPSASGAKRTIKKRKSLEDAVTRIDRENPVPAEFLEVSRKI